MSTLVTILTAFVGVLLGAVIAKFGHQGIGLCIACGWLLIVPAIVGKV